MKMTSAVSLLVLSILLILSACQASPATGSDPGSSQGRDLFEPDVYGKTRFVFLDFSTFFADDFGLCLHGPAEEEEKRLKIVAPTGMVIDKVTALTASVESGEKPNNPTLVPIHKDKLERPAPTYIVKGFDNAHLSILQRDHSTGLYLEVVVSDPNDEARPAHTFRFEPTAWKVVKPKTDTEWEFELTE